MLSDKYRPNCWADFVGQPIITEIHAACEESDLFEYGGERWLFESDGIARCGKTSAAYVVADTLGIDQPAFSRGEQARLEAIADYHEGELARKSDRSQAVKPTLSARWKWQSRKHAGTGLIEVVDQAQTVVAEISIDRRPSASQCAEIGRLLAEIITES